MFNPNPRTPVRGKFTKIMYQGKTKVLNPERNEESRAAVITCRGGAIWNSFLELEDIINKSELAKQYFDRSPSWFSQKLNGSTVEDETRAFTAPEARKIAGAFRDIASRLCALADEIDAVADID